MREDRTAWMRDELQRLYARGGKLTADDERELDAILDRHYASQIAAELHVEFPGTIEHATPPAPIEPEAPEWYDPAQLAFWDSIAPEPEPEPLTLF